MDRAKLGAELRNWKIPDVPNFTEISGRYAKLVRLSANEHAAHLFRAFDGHDHIWDYLPYGPFNSSAQYFRFVSDLSMNTDPYFWPSKTRKRVNAWVCNHIYEFLQRQVVLNWVTFVSLRLSSAHQYQPKHFF